MRDADAELEPPARDLVDVGGALGEFLDRLGVDRRDRGGKTDALRGKGQPRALRHVGEGAGYLDLGEAAPLDLAGDVEGGAPLARFGDQVQGG